MSKTIDINSNTGAPTPQKAKGGLSRTLFTLAIAVAVCLSVLSFLWVLERTTRDSGSRIDVTQRTEAQVFRDALSLPQKPLRLRALRNFKTAYPESTSNTQADSLITALETEEYESWLTLSDVFYTTSENRDDRLAAAQNFEQDWGSGTYHSEVTAMLEQLELEPEPDAQKIKPLAAAKRPASAQEGRMATQSAQEDLMAGGPPIVEIFQPAVLLPLANAEPVIVPAVITQDVQPSYPSRAQNRGIEANVTVSMDVGADGRVKDAYIVVPATGRYANDFGRAAIRAAERTRFTPKTIDGEVAPTNGFTRRYRFEVEDD